MPNTTAPPQRQAPPPWPPAAQAGQTSATAMPDWSAPWFAPFARHGRAVLAALQRQTPDASAPLPQALNAAHTPTASHAAHGMRFVPQASLPEGCAYEAFIHAHAQVPTREGWHDFFNALVWHALPLAKRRMNALQAAEIARCGVGAQRGAVRDALTLLDENGALLHAPDALWQALHQRRWGDVFGTLRPLWAHAALLLPGHAALEKLLAPYKSITVHVWRTPVAFDPLGDLGALDAWLAQDLQPEKLAAKPFAALPVLGVPGWWAANAQPAFYDDAAIFRPPRTAAA